uniref:Uncharacterized protein n=1 Tax=Brevibacterium sp. Ap13 TaxID=1406197 RepID=U5NZJ7_9MICO|nr:hypothetical protein [Brevibacterium sp. Ap13]AGY35340.1 hypothetical protein AP13_p00310 [Brevibacterium sp. Ap13]
MPVNPRINETTVQVLSSLYEHSRSFASDHGREIEAINNSNSVEVAEFLTRVLAEDAARAARCQHLLEQVFSGEDDFLSGLAESSTQETQTPTVSGDADANLLRP